MVREVWHIRGIVQDVEIVDGNMKYNICRCIVFLGIVCCCFSCTFTSEQKYVKYVAPTVGVKTVNGELPRLDLLSDLSTDFFNKEIDSISFIPLETSDSVLIGQISGIYCLEDRMLIVDANKAQRIFVFNLDGDYLYSIGSKGGGPGQYTSLNQVRVDKEIVSVFDWMKWKYICYDIEGNVLYERVFSTKMPEVLLQRDDSTFIGSYAGYYENYPFHLSWINGHDSIIDTGLPIRNPHPTPAGTLQYAMDGSLLFYHSLCDTIYEIDEREIIPKLSLGLYKKGEVDAFLSRTRNMGKGEYNQTLFDYRKGEITNHFSMLETPDSWLIEHQKGAFVYFSVVEKNGPTRNYIRTDMQSRKIYIPFSVMNVKENRLLCYIDEAFQLKIGEENKQRFINQISSEKDRSLLNSYDAETQNPIICMLHLKHRP